MKKSFGFTLVEIVIVTVIIAILAVVSVPIYRSHVDRSYTLEGQALLNEFAAAQEIFRDRYGRWWGTDKDGNEKLDKVDILKRDLGVDTSRNYYFKDITGLEFLQETEIDGKKTGNAFLITITGTSTAAGITMQLLYSYDSPPKISAVKNGRIIKGYIADVSK